MMHRVLKDGVLETGFTVVLEHATLAQFNLKRGLEMFGQAATDAVSKEMKQLHDRKTIRPRHSKDLTDSALDHSRSV
jgi:hypothetical protein